MVMKNIYKDAEHPFAKYVRILGKGKTGSRSLTFEEARDAFRMILDGETLDVQTGAFLMLLRVKEESPEELAGFVAATRDWIPSPDIAVDLDWSSYAGKRKHYPWFLLAALILLLAQAGSHVPAAAATLGIADRIFSRVGAADNLARGRSTFMVEMVETAAILAQASPQSRPF